MSLQASFRKDLGTMTLAVELSVAPGETVALVGPNGAGKTSTLRVVAGLSAIDEGKVTIGERGVDGGPGSHFVDTANRHVGFVFQDHRLFPHLDALGNVAFGLRAQGLARREAKRQAESWLERVGVGGDLGSLRPGKLSGGQAQRVALARALAVRPEVLLLDEPLASVDASGRLQLRQLLADVLSDFPGGRVLVAHDLDDARALAQRIAVLEDGQITRSGTLAELTRAPGSRYAADLVGVNRVVGEARNGVVRHGSGAVFHVASQDGTVALTFHPRAVSLFPTEPVGSPRNVWRGRVASIQSGAAFVRVEVEGPVSVVAEITQASIDTVGVAVGRDVWAAVKSTEIRAQPV